MPITEALSGYVRVPAGTNAVVKYAKIAASSSGDNTIVAAVAGKKIRVLSVYYLCAGTVTATWQSGASGTALSGALAHTAQTGAVLPHNENGWFESASGVLLNLSLNGAISVAGGLSYIEV